LAPADIRRVLSAPHDKGTKTKNKVNVSHHDFTYHVSNHQGAARIKSSLVDHGANGGLAGSNMRVIAYTDRQVDVMGIDDHQMTGLHIVTAGGIVPTQRGDVIGIFHQYAHVPQGRSIHSSIQLESFGTKVDDRAKTLSGSQSLTTLEGYVLPLDFINGLPYLPIRPYTDHEWKNLPHVCFTSDVDWDPTLIDNIISDQEEWYDALSDLPQDNFFHDFDEVGDPQSVTAVNSCSFKELFNGNFGSFATRVKPAPHTYEKYRDYFLRASNEVIKHTFKATTQFARSGWITGRIYDTHRAPFPALNVI
jgi:hypothetical protein